MKQLFTPIIALLILAISFQAAADKKNALFIGNSYTFYNSGLPVMINNIANSLGDTLTHDSSTPGGYTAQQHTTNATTLSKIALGGWDYVSIQCQSQEPSFSMAQVDAQTYPFVMSLDSSIQAGNTCAETLMFMTWGRKVGDLANYPSDTYDAMQQRLRLAYLRFADSANASTSPVGAAWKIMRDTYPLVDLYSPDGSHPSLNGTYLAACVFYCTMFKKSCVGSLYLPGGVGNADALNMQQIASNLVLDSLEKWQGDGGIPDASFTYAPTAPAAQNFLTFTNTSKRFSTSSWSFGDGSPNGNPATSPVHSFPAAGGTFKVCLEVTSACGKTDSICQNVTLNNVLSSSDFSKTDKIKITQSSHLLSITNNIGNCKATVYDMNGAKVFYKTLENGKTNISTNDFAKGIYILHISQNNQLLKLKKIFNY